MARKIAGEVPGIGKVGVFVNAALPDVQDIARECRLDYVQLHGEETADYCAAVDLPVIKAVRADPNLNFAALNRCPAEWILLDSFRQGQFGGTGLPFDWAGMGKLRALLSKPLMIAGGLDSGNVQAALDMLTPDGVDVSGGVETDGEKDPEKIERFIRAVRVRRSSCAGENCKPKAPGSSRR